MPLTTTPQEDGQQWQTYSGVNREHLSELLAEREGLVVPARTLRRILAEAGLPAVRRRRPRGHRLRREHMTQAGLLLQVDGSRHDWLEGRGPWLTPVGGIDDATGRVTGATFREQEDSAGYLEVLVHCSGARSSSASRSRRRDARNQDRRRRVSEPSTLRQPRAAARCGGARSATPDHPVRRTAAWRQLAKRTAEAHVALHGWTCPGWHREPHPVRPGELAADHLVPLVLGGEPLPARPGVLCASCNARKGLSQRRR
jgi:hypothetical protein